MDILLQKFFEMERWEQALETGVDKHIDKGELRKLTSPEVRLAMYNAIANDNFEEFKKELHELVLLAQEVNYAKRCLLKTSINKGHLPLYTNGYMDLSKQFSTLGFVGLSDACDIFNKSIITEEGLNFIDEHYNIIFVHKSNTKKDYRVGEYIEGRIIKTTPKLDNNFETSSI